MDDDREKMALNMRLMAIEYQLTRVYNLVLHVAGANEEMIAQGERSVIDSIDNVPMGQDDPAQSGLLIGEFQDALYKLFRDARDHRSGNVLGRPKAEPSEPPASDA